MQRRAFLFGICAACAAPAMALSQSTSILLIDSDEVYRRSKFGVALRQQAEQDRLVLQAENERLFKALEAAELELTQNRKSMSPEDFQKAALEFDLKVQETRKDQDAKQRLSDQTLAAIKRRFAQQIEPVVASVMRERGGLIVLEEASVSYRLPEIVITEEVIERVDEAFARSQEDQTETNVEE